MERLEMANNNNNDDRAVEGSGWGGGESLTVEQAGKHRATVCQFSCIRRVGLSTSFLFRPICTLHFDTANEIRRRVKGIVNVYCWVWIASVLKKLKESF